MARIAIKDAKDILKRRKLSCCVIFGWEGETCRQHVATYGRGIENAAQAAAFGNRIKQACGWPDRLCHAEPARVRRLKKRVQELEDRIAGAVV